MTHVAEALSSAADEIEVNPNDDDVAASYAAVQQKCAIYDLLITVHARGEYLLYQLVINESGILSCVQQIIDEFKDPDETTKAWYETRINMLEEQKAMLICSPTRAGYLMMLRKRMALSKRMTLLKIAPMTATSPLRSSRRR